MERAGGDFTRGSVARNILAQAIPLTVAQLVQCLYNVVDRSYTRPLPGGGTDALTGIGLVFPVVTFIGAFTMWYSSGGAPLCAIARGAGKTERAERLQGNTLTLQLVTSVALMAVCYLFQRPVLYAFGASDATYFYADQYLTIYLLGTPFAMVSTGMNQFINAQGEPRIGMLTTVLGAALNIVLDPIFIFAFDMGVPGAALATILSQLVSAVWVLHFLLSRRSILRLSWETMRPDWPLIREILALGVTGFIMQATNCLSQVVCNVGMKLYAGAQRDLYIGIMTVVNSIREIIQLPVIGITNGAQPVLGYNYGAGQYRRVQQGILFMFFCGLAYTAVVWAAVLLEPRFFLGIFSSDSALVENGVRGVRIYFLAFLTMNLQYAGQTSFTSLGKAKRAVFFSLFRKVVIVLPLTLLLPQWMGVDGVFAAEPISNVIGGGACFLTMMLTLYRPLGRAAAGQEPPIGR